MSALQSKIANMKNEKTQIGALYVSYSLSIKKPSTSLVNTPNPFPVTVKYCGTWQLLMLTKEAAVVKITLIKLHVNCCRLVNCRRRPMMTSEDKETCPLAPGGPVSRRPCGGLKKTLDGASLRSLSSAHKKTPARGG